MDCPHCYSKCVVKRSRLTRHGYKTFFCKDCRRTFNERTSTPFNRWQAPTTTIFQIVFERLRYKLSLADLAEKLWLEGYYFSRETVREWQEEFAPVISEELQQTRQGRATDRWRVDETLIKVKQKYVYLYRAIDSNGQLVASLLYETRNLENTTNFLEQAVAVSGEKAVQVTSYKEVSYPGAIKRVLGRETFHRTARYLNNRLEQDHLWIKGRYRVMKGFKRLESAPKFCEAYDEVRQHFKERRWHKDKRTARWKRANFKSRYYQLKQKFTNRQLVWKQSQMPLLA